MFPQYLTRNKPRRRGLGRIQTVILNTTLPGPGDDGFVSGVIAGVGQHSVDVQAGGRKGAHAASRTRDEEPVTILFLFGISTWGGGLARLQSHYEFSPALSLPSLIAAGPPPEDR
ncbi:hypothetical protein D3C85_1595670 [compost metagenome]